MPLVSATYGDQLRAQVTVPSGMAYLIKKVEIDFYDGTGMPAGNIPAYLSCVVSHGTVPADFDPSSARTICAANVLAGPYVDGAELFTTSPYMSSFSWDAPTSFYTTGPSLFAEFSQYYYDLCSVAVGVFVVPYFMGRGNAKLTQIPRY